MLTRKQLELLDFIKTRLDRDGVPPSFDEMKDALDLRSKSGIHRLITALEFLRIMSLCFHCYEPGNDKLKRCVNVPIGKNPTY